MSFDKQASKGGREAGKEVKSRRVALSLSLSLSHCLFSSFVAVAASAVDRLLLFFAVFRICRFSQKKFFFSSFFFFFSFFLFSSLFTTVSEINSGNVEIGLANVSYRKDEIYRKIGYWSFFFDCFRAEGLVTDEEEEKREEEEGVSATRLNGGTCMPC